MIKHRSNKRPRLGEPKPISVEVTKQDIETGMDVGKCFAKEFEAGAFKPFDVASPLLMSMLRTRTSGFLIFIDSGETIFVVDNDDADELRRIYAERISGKTTPEQFHDLALPLFLKLRASVLN
jgi:hypothetical protein